MWTISATLLYISLISPDKYSVYNYITNIMLMLSIFPLFRAISYDTINRSKVIYIYIKLCVDIIRTFSY